MQVRASNLYPFTFRQIRRNIQVTLVPVVIDVLQGGATLSLAHDIIDDIDYMNHPFLWIYAKSQKFSSRCCPALSGAIIIPYRAPNVKGFWEKIIIFSSFSVHIKIWWKLCQKMQHSILHLLFSKVKAFWKIHFSLIFLRFLLYIFISMLYRISFWFFCVMNTNRV